jgi:MFS family permease
MLASITPLGERGRSRRWAVSAPSFVVGSVLGGLVVGLLAGAIGGALLAVVDVGTTGRLAVLLVALVAAIALDLRVAGLRPPGPRRQVNEDWLEIYREWVYGAGFGVQLGAAVVTQVATAAVWVMLLAAAMTGSLLGGAAVGVVFGAVRAVPVLLTARVRTPGALHALHVRAAAWEPRAHRVTVAVLGGAGVAVLGLLAAVVGAGPVAGSLAAGAP